MAKAPLGPHRAALALVALALLAVARPAAAHSVDLSRGDYVVAGAAVSATIVLARANDLSPDAVAAAIAVEDAGTPCPGSLVASAPDPPDGVSISLRFTCPAPPRALRVDASRLLALLPPGHRHVARLAAEGRPPVDDILTRDHATLTQGAPSEGFLAMLALGARHIFEGWDHLLFLFGLVLVGGKLRALAGVVTAFTVAHSISLALAALGVFAPSPATVEPLIALSIAYVGVENFFVKDASRRWRITFPFGLVHGFGFAAALRAIDLPRAELPKALLAFNLGVEAGQLAIVLVLVPVILRLERFAWYRRRAVPWASAVLVLCGIALAVSRVLALVLHPAHA